MLVHYQLKHASAALLSALFQRHNIFLPGPRRVPAAPPSPPSPPPFCVIAPARQQRERFSDLRAQLPEVRSPLAPTAGSVWGAYPASPCCWPAHAVTLPSRSLQDEAYYVANSIEGEVADEATGMRFPPYVRLRVHACRPAGLDCEGKRQGQASCLCRVKCVPTCVPTVLLSQYNGADPANCVVRVIGELWAGRHVPAQLPCSTPPFLTCS